MTAAAAAPTLPGIDAHAHARAILLPALPPAGAPSHAYLFHGPAGAGKRTVARAFAAALLADGAANPAGVAQRVAHGTHPDLTWVVPSGALEMLVSDVDEAVVASVARTPFESRRRVFVIEAAQTMSDQVANRLLKTLEEPPAFAHLIVIAQSLHDVLPTIASRCQPVRFDAPSYELMQERLQQQPVYASALGFVRDALHGRTQERPWLAVLEQAKADGAQAGAEVLQRAEEQLELLPAKERRRYLREATDAQRRSERRARTATLDTALRLAELWLRDVWLLTLGAPELIYAVARKGELHEDAAAREPAQLRRALELIGQTRLRLQLNVAEELALETLAYRLAGDTRPSSAAA
jgi:DNA polymerase-3 subunit delta'